MNGSVYGGISCSPRASKWSTHASHVRSVENGTNAWVVDASRVRDAPTSAIFALKDSMSSADRSEAAGVERGRATRRHMSERKGEVSG